MSGEKTTAIRWDDPIAVGPATFVFEDHPDFAHAEGEIRSVERIRLIDLDADHAAGLQSHYPSMPQDAALSRVTFRLSPS